MGLGEGQGTLDADTADRPVVSWRDWQPGCWTLFAVSVAAMLAVAVIYTLGAL